MKLRSYILVILTTLLAVTANVHANQDAGSAKTKEHQIKAAFLYNFFSFIDWPKDKQSSSNDTITIGVVITDESKDFINTLKPLTKKEIRGKSITLKLFDKLDCIENPDTQNKMERQALVESMKQCHLLMICERNQAKLKNISEIIEGLKGTATLTVGETPSFLEKGGIINFVVVDNKIRFEINLDAAKQNKLLIRAKLLKLAKRVINKK